MNFFTDLKYTTTAWKSSDISSIGMQWYDTPVILFTLNLMQVLQINMAKERGNNTWHIPIIILIKKNKKRNLVKIHHPSENLLVSYCLSTTLKYKHTFIIII